MIVANDKREVSKAIFQTMSKKRKMMAKAKIFKNVSKRIKIQKKKIWNLLDARREYLFYVLFVSIAV